MKLLMVNDEILTVETMKTDIPWKQYGIDEVYTAYNVESGKSCIQEKSIDIILCDIEMPGENGLDLLRWIRENEKDIECIFLTCHASFEYAKEAIQLGCQDYLLIPAKYETIGDAVLKVVNRIILKQETVRYQVYGKQAMKEKINKVTDIYGHKKMQDIVEETICYVLENLGSDTLSVNEIAEKLFIHPIHLNRIFKKEKKISLGQYIISERMKMAGELLKTKHINANVVSELVGYKSYSNFNLMFKKYYGCPPSQYNEER